MPSVPVSIVIPTYRRPDMLIGALDSVAAQTVTGAEVIVVDDAADARTASVVADHPLPATCLAQDHRGAAAARNTGLARASADCVAFLDDDDRWRDGFLPRMLGLMRDRPELLMAYSDFISTDPSGRPLRGHRKRPHAGRVTPELFASIFIHTSCVVARRTALLAAGGFDETLPCSEDYDLWLKLSLRGPFGLIDEPLVQRTVHPNSLSRTDLPDKLRCKAEMLERFYTSLGGRDAVDPRRARRRLAKVFYSAAKAHVKARRAGDAVALLRRSRHYGGAWHKRLALALRARLQGGAA